jgi:hypothetical protein
MVNNAQFVFAKGSLTRLIIFGYLNISTKTRIKNICKNKRHLHIFCKKRVIYNLKNIFKIYNELKLMYNTSKLKKGIIINDDNYEYTYWMLKATKYGMYSW